MLGPAHGADLAASPYGALAVPAAQPQGEETLYLRGSIGLEAGAAPDVAIAGVKINGVSRSDSLSLGVALGGVFAPDWRAELDVNPLFGSRIKYNSSTLTVAGVNYSAGAAMSGVIVPVTIDLYHDFDIGSAFKPYVGAGAGLALSSTDLTANLAAGSQTYNYKIASTVSPSFAAALMAGVAFEASKNLTLDLGYKLLYVDEIKATKTFDTFAISAVAKRNVFNEVMLGARYSFP